MCMSMVTFTSNVMSVPMLTFMSMPMSSYVFVYVYGYVLPTVDIVDCFFRFFLWFMEELQMKIHSGTIVVTIVIYQ